MSMEFDRYHTVLRAAQNVTFSKNTAAKLVGGQRRLENLVAEDRIRAIKTTGKSSVSCPLKPSDSAPLC